MPPLPVAPAIGHVGIRPEIIPARRERRPIGQRSGLVQQGAHLHRLDEPVAIGTYRIN